MALSKEQWEEVSKAMKTLRDLGCAVCVFTPDDVESAHDGEDPDAAEADERTQMTDQQSAEWMDGNRKYLEDTLSTAGNLFIADNLNTIPA